MCTCGFTIWTLSNSAPYGRFYNLLFTMARDFLRTAFYRDPGNSCLSLTVPNPTFWQNFRVRVSCSLSKFQPHGGGGVRGGGGFSLCSGKSSSLAEFLSIPVKCFRFSIGMSKFTETR